MGKYVISLCDFTGIAVKPWVESGYKAILVDPQHKVSGKGYTREGPVTKVGRVIDDSLTYKVIRETIKDNEIGFVFGFPPCTDVAVSGARWFEKKREEDKYFQAKAALVAEQCRVIGQLSGAPWFFENPVSVFSSIFGKPDHYFHPYEYGGYLPKNKKHPWWPEYIEPRDAYSKKTCLWSGGGFDMPQKKPVPVSDGPSKQYSQLGGSSQKTKNIRSATPYGFSKAVFVANR